MDSTIKYNGSIHLILGCMFSGKTTELMNTMKRFKSIGKNVMVINYKLDDRYGNDIVSSHDSIGVNAYMLEKLSDIYTNEEINDKYKNSDYIFINEGQFFEDLYEFCNKSANEENKHLYICGLDGDYKQEKFGSLLDLIPISDTYKKLYALCKICGLPASFSKRIVENKEQIVIGNNDTYIPVCRKHYFV